MQNFLGEAAGCRALPPREQAGVCRRLPHNQRTRTPSPPCPIPTQVLGGVEATQEIRQLGCAVPIVAMTANASERDRVECIAAGMDGFLRCGASWGSVRTPPLLAWAWRERVGRLGSEPAAAPGALRSPGSACPAQPAVSRPPRRLCPTTSAASAASPC